MTDQDRFDNFIGRAARDSDRVPETPRDEMWGAISAARAESKTETAGVIPLASRQPKTRTHVWLRWGSLAAAMAIITFGLGRLSTHVSHSTITQQTVANATPTQRPADSAAATTATTSDRTLDKLNQPPITAVTAPRAPGLAVAVKSGKSRMTNSAIIRDNSNATADAVVVSYRYAASKHFARVQTLLVTLPDDARDGHINEIAVRAADLLVNTRLLLDSPAARDTETKRLLDDLELILAQVATISPTHSAEDVQMIQDAITKHDVLLRLRAITAGPRLSGT